MKWSPDAQRPSGRVTFAFIIIFFALLLLTLLLTAGGTRIDAHASGRVQQELPWTARHLNDGISFSYPSNFIAADDGSPGFILAGGALMNASRTDYDLLLGVAVDYSQGHTVSGNAHQLKLAYKHASLTVDRQTPYGLELAFVWPENGDTYLVYLAKIPQGVREIIVNNEHSDVRYQPWIERFLKSVHGPIGATGTANA